MAMASSLRGLPFGSIGNHSSRQRYLGTPGNIELNVICVGGAEEARSAARQTAPFRRLRIDRVGHSKKRPGSTGATRPERCGGFLTSLPSAPDTEAAPDRGRIGALSGALLR